jgi:3-hydroxybutyryl-CoA dehydrogenase
VKIKTVAVIGSGVMGQGIAQASAAAGFEVSMFDVAHESTIRALGEIEKSLTQSVSRGRVSDAERMGVMSRLRRVATIDEVKGDLIIEAILEKLEPKQDLLARVERNNKGTILATNTSTFPVAHVAAKLQDASVCIGLHFFNPAHVMKLVEVIAGPATSPAVVETTTEFVRALQKVPVLASDSPGFIVNRVARSFYLEALKLLEEGAASQETIDKLMRGTGFRMGPFELMDLIGLDTNLAVTESLHEAFGKPEKFRPSPIQVAMVKQRKFGVKTGQGFYVYPR